MNAHGVEIAALKRGDIVHTASGERREVTRVVDTDGAMGGIVDTKRVGGTWNRSNGFRHGDDIVAVERLAPVDDRPGSDIVACTDPTHVDGCPGLAGGDHEKRPIDIVWCHVDEKPATVNFRRADGEIVGACTFHDPRAFTHTFEAPELPTRSEREVTRTFDAIELHFYDRDYRAALKAAQDLVLQLHAMAIFGRQGVDAIPVTISATVGLDSPAGAGADVEADRG